MENELKRKILHSFIHSFQPFISSVFDYHLEEHLREFGNQNRKENLDLSIYDCNITRLKEWKMENGKMAKMEIGNRNSYSYRRIRISIEGLSSGSFFWEFWDSNLLDSLNGENMMS